MTERVNEYRVALRVMLEESIRDELKILAAKKKTSMNELIVSAIIDLLKTENVK